MTKQITDADWDAIARVFQAVHQRRASRRRGDQENGGEEPEPSSSVDESTP